MTIWETILIYAVIPGAIVALLAVLTVGAHHHRTKVRYEPGQEWHHSPHFWAGSAPVAAIPAADRVGTTRGGAHGTW